MSDETRFTEEERRALEAWQVPGAPVGFAGRVLAREAVVARRARLVRVTALAAAALLAMGGAAWWLSRGEPSAGALTAEVRTSQRLGERGVAVLEPGAALRWTIARDGAAALEQSRGAVFYRVEPGGAFTVRVPEGEVRVRGTCFEVEVRDMAAWGPAMGGAAVGAAVAALVVVTVYEGKVEVARGGEVRAVGPGERATLGDGIAVASASGGRVAERPGAPAPKGPSTTRVVATPDEGVGPPVHRAGQGGEAVAEGGDVATLQRENAALRTELAGLRLRIAEADAVREAHKTYDIGQAELDRMAERCELRWDTIGYRLGEPPRVPREEADAFELSEAQLTALDERLAAENARLIEAIRQAYVEVTGDDPAAIQAVAPEALFTEVQDKTPIEERRRIFRLLAEERASGVEPDVSPPRLANLSPAERMFRVITTSGDRLEAAMGEVVGPEVARQMRDAHRGFGNRHRSSFGCPEEGR